MYSLTELLVRFASDRRTSRAPRFTQRTSAAAVALATAFVPLPAIAQTTPAAGVAPSAESAGSPSSPAYVQYRRAHEAIKQKDWLEARRLLLELWANSKTYDVAASLGQVEYQMKNYAAGARYLAFAVRNVPPMEKAETIARFNTALEEVKRHVGSVHVSVTPPNAEVSVDGALLETTAVPEIFLDPGTHTFEARVNGGDRTSKTLDVEAGGSYSVDLVVPGLPPSAESEPTAAQPAAPVSAPPADVRPAPARSPERSMVPVYVGAGVTVVGATLAVVFGLAAKSDRDDLDRYRRHLGPDACSGPRPAPDCSSAQAAYDHQRRDATVANIGIGVGATAAVATLAYYFLWPHSGASPSAAHIAPQLAVAPNAAHIGLSATF